MNKVIVRISESDSEKLPFLAICVMLYKPLFKSFGLATVFEKSILCCIVLIKNTVETNYCEILWHFKITVFYFKIF